jgi:hypothetical protein
MSRVVVATENEKLTASPSVGPDSFMERYRL